MSLRLSCGHCHSPSLFIVTRDVPGSPQAGACKAHLAIAVQKTAQQAQAGSVTVYLPEAGLPGPGGEAGIGEILERVRRLGAHSAAQPDFAHQMEDALYLAVLALIARGAQSPSGLASAALTSRNYGFERRCG